jgi:nucleoside 2-deoxyribosyltransferase
MNRSSQGCGDTGGYLPLANRGALPSDAGAVSPGLGRSFLIAPVRGLPAEAWRELVAKLEREGWSVHWPARDTEQIDAVGLDICRQNLAAMADSDAVHVVWDGESQGCLFDLGMAFALGKRVIPLALPEPTAGKSFQNMVRAWAT